MNVWFPRCSSTLETLRGLIQPKDGLSYVKLCFICYVIHVQASPTDYWPLLIQIESK